ncbi:MAG TPA: protein kinase [Pirellulales bacterium]|jgi:serine/threonine-protein kinase|nr:protein kinase [Pirellulales bacterium]
MTDETRIQQLLDELLATDTTPEAVCKSCPELLPVVREKLWRVRRLGAELDALFPPLDVAVPPRQGTGLPQVQGYEVEEPLGRGGMGVVFRARHLRLDRLVALKMLLVGACATPDERARFHREAEAVARLKHPNIVQVYDVGDSDGQPYFTMELLDGGSLAQELSGTPQPARQVAALVATLAEAVHAAHQGGIVHRDLKPANILLTADGTPKVADFGLARHFEGEAVTMTGARIGTPSYMAPEQVVAKAGTIGPAADIYGLGALLYEMLTGRPPFRGETAAETQRQVISDEPVPPSRLSTKVPRDLETICLKCLSKEPKRRYASAAALADDLRRFGEGRPLLARPVGRAERTWRWCRRNPTLAALLFMALALVGLAVGGGFWVERQQADRRTQTARLEGRQSEAAEAVLEQAAALQKKGQWPEAKAALEGAPNLADIPALTNLRERLDRALTDVHMVTRLEDIPIRQVEVRASSAHRQYVDAFREYGIDLPAPEPAEAAARIRESAIHETLLAFIHDWLFFWGSETDQDQLATVLDLADDDDWRRRLRKTWRGTYDAGERHDLLRAREALDQPPLMLGLVHSSMNPGSEREEALALVRKAQLLHPEDYWINLQLGGILLTERPGEAVGYFRAAVASRPESSQAHIMLGRALNDSGDTDGAIAAFRKAIPLTSLRCAPRDLAKALASRGGMEEARLHWAEMLAANPPNYDPWDGYALLCAYLGNEEAYRSARKALLDRSRDGTEHWTAAERDGQACLVLPASDEELRRAVVLVDRAVATGPTFFPPKAWIQFVEGLAAYRQGRPEQAVLLLEESAALLPNRAGPRVALAMAQFRSSRPAEARKTLAAAVRASNWMESQADHPAHWVSHLLRREAEAQILPDLPAFLRGEYEPQDNDERLALVGICQSQGRYARAARLYAAAFTADPHLADSLNTECRYRSTEDEPFYERVESLNTEGYYLAARCAALAGRGLGRDGERLSGAERTRWRQQARAWLQADLGLWAKTLVNGSEKDLALARKMLTRWQAEPDLAGIRDLKALDEASAEERNECFGLWDEVGAVLRQIAVQERDIVLDPKLADPRRAIPIELLEQGRLEEARRAWQTVLEANPLDHNVWWGYAELCLFLGREDEYRRARQDLLARFFVTSNPYFAERTGRACLLLPATGDELRQAVALARRAAAYDPSAYGEDYSWFLLARGLAEYREGKFDQAISTMRGGPSRLDGSMARLVLAMALHQVGQLGEARKTLAAAMLSDDWRSVKARDSGAWICHVLRREAEGLVLPNLPAFRRGEYQPQDNDERLALLAGQLASCEFEGLQGAAARLYSEIFAAEPRLADDVPAGARYYGARAAALAGCGQGEDADQLNDEERALLRRQALDWLRADLTSCRQRLDEENARPNGNAQPNAWIRQRLQLWWDDPALDAVRAKDALAKLPGEERERWARLWSDADALLRRMSVPE